MKHQKTLALLFAILLGTVWQVGFSPAAQAKDATMTEGNVWSTADGQKRYTCPVMGGEGLVSNAPTYSDVDGVRYYHCCSGCEAKFQADPSQFLANLAVPANISSMDESGKHFSDPISGKKRVVTAKTAYHDQDGKRYYFASKRSKKEFCKTSSSCEKSCARPCAASCKKTCK